MQVYLESLKRPILKEEVATWLKNFPELEKWLMRKSNETKDQYIRRLIRYIEILNKNGIITEKSPTGLLELARQRTEESQPHVEYLEEFQTDCESILPQDKLAVVFTVSIAVKSFYNFKGYTFPRFRGNFQYSPKEKTRIPKLEEIIEYIDSVKNMRIKVLIALLSSAPIRMGSLIKLKWSHFKEVLEDQEIPMIKLESFELKGSGRGKYRGVKQICFLTPFCKDWIRRYALWYQTETNRKISLDDPQSLELPFLIADNEASPMTHDGLNSAIERSKTVKFPFRFHIWRTVVNEALMKVGMSKEHRDIYIGHKQPMIEKAYSITLEIKKEFQEAMKYLDPTYKQDEKVAKIKGKSKNSKA
jgi:integrase